MKFKRHKVALADDEINTTKDIEQVIKRITYKPNATLKVMSIGTRSVEIQLRQSVPDTYHPGRQTDVFSTVTCRPEMFTDVHDLLAFIRVAMLHAMEIHESDEWFRFDGELVFDPHSEGLTSNYDFTKKQDEWVVVPV